MLGSLLGHLLRWWGLLEVLHSLIMLLRIISLLSHLVEVGIATSKLILKRHINLGHNLRRPALLEYVWHSVCLDHGEDDLNDVRVTIGTEVLTLSEQHSQEIS